METKEYTKTNSKTLLIPGGLLSSGSSHQVVVEVKADDSVIAKVRTIHLHWTTFNWLSSRLMALCKFWPVIFTFKWCPTTNPLG